MAARASVYLHGEEQTGTLFFSDIPNDILPGQDGTTLRFLSVVEVSKIPLYIAIGSPFTVETDSEDVEKWFHQVLVGPSAKDDRQKLWWQARPDSQLGVLLSVDIAASTENKTSNLPTELLLYATSYDSGRITGSSRTNEPAGAELEVKALPLNSHLLHFSHYGEPTPPSSPSRLANDVDAVFLRQALPNPEETVNELQGRKRKSASDFLDEATERRGKARRKGGEGVSAAASRSESQVPALLHRRSMSNSMNLAKLPRALSRSPSVSSSRPGTAIAPGTTRSSLSRIQSLAVDHVPSDMATRNKESISRIVMAGMRLYGLSQKKRRKTQSTGTGSPAVDVSFDELEAERKRDEEYKVVYHQTFKGTCFAFRSVIDEQDLRPMSQTVRDVVDRLLELFCNDPLVDRLPGLADKLTPGGRTAFGYNGREEGISLHPGQTPQTALQAG